jgi:hypothetical protein
MFENYTRTQILIFVAVMAVLTALTVLGVHYVLHAFVLRPIV